jgi:Arc/MetJ-type ribon-helix-helix transcriptional regulator
MPQWMIDETEARREKGCSRSEYVRDALRKRWELEDAGEWEPPARDQPGYPDP